MKRRMAGAWRGAAPRGLGSDCRLLVGAALVSTAGDWIYRLALPLLVYELTHSAVGTALTYALQYAPYLLLSPLAGVVTDRVDRRQLLILVDSCSAAVLAVLVLLLLQGAERVEFVFAAAVLLASLAPVQHPAFQGLLPSVAPRGELARATARVQASESFVAFLGPLLGGVVIVALGTTWALALDAASFAASALAIAALRARGRKNTRPAAIGARSVSALWRDLREAIAYVRADGVLLAGAGMFAGANFAVFLVQANLVFYLVDFRHVDAAMIGVVLAAQGAGSFLGAALAPALGRRYTPGYLLLGGTAAAGASMLLLIAAPGVVAVAAVWAIESAAGAVTAVTWFTLRVTRVPEALLGRVVALTRMLAFASIPAGSLVGGVLLATLGDFWPLIALGGGLQLALGVAGLRTALGARAGRRVEAPAATVPAA